MQSTLKKSKASQTWQGLNGFVEGLAVVVSLPFVPPVAVWRSFERIGQQNRLAEIRREYEQTHYQIEQASRLPVKSLNTYFKRLAELHSRFLTTSWHSLAEAEAGYQMLLIAQASLLAEAQATLIRQVTTKDAQV